jgi:hypothetical protein
MVKTPLSLELRLLVLRAIENISFLEKRALSWGGHPAREQKNSFPKSG